MQQPSDRNAVGRWRRIVFAAWVALTVVVAVFVAVAAPFTAYFREDMWIVAVIVPPLMIVMMGIGLLWLVAVVTSRSGGDRRQEQESETGDRQQRELQGSR